MPRAAVGHMTPRVRRFPAFAISVVTALAVVACGSTSPDQATSSGQPTRPSLSTAPGQSARSTPAQTASGPVGRSESPSGSAARPTPTQDATPGSSDAAVYARINDQVQALRGLDETVAVTPTLVSSAEIAAIVKTEFAAETPPALVTASEQLYKAMGLLPADASLADLYDRLLESQVAGLYVPSSRRLYVVSKGGTVGPVERVFYSHEYDHALQDQHFGLQAFEKGLEHDSDRALARQSLVEGDAYVTMTLWMQQNLSPADLVTVLGASLDPKATQALAAIPRIVQAQILFAATQGTQFVFGLEASGGWPRVNEAWADPPASTEQILHADKYASHEPVVPVTLPDDLALRTGPGWTLTTSDTLGEYQLSIWLEDAGGLSQAVAEPAAAGWGGDRIALLAGPNDAKALVYLSAWDTPADASEFETAAATLTRELGVSLGHAAVLPGPTGTSRWLLAATDGASFQRLQGALGVGG